LPNYFKKNGGVMVVRLLASIGLTLVDEMLRTASGLSFK